MEYLDDEENLKLIVKNVEEDVWDGMLFFSEEERGKVWKDYMKRIMNEENDWDHNMEGDAVEGHVDCVSRE